jgi:heme exporter protein C
MWWKALSVILILYSLIAGLRVPLKAGIESADPSYVRTGKTQTIRFYGYNTDFEAPAGQPIRVWLTYDSVYAIAAQSVKPVDARTLEATFKMPENLPGGEKVAYLNAIVDHPATGVALLPSAVELMQDTVPVSVSGIDPLWRVAPVERISVQKSFSFPYQNVIYESIRNTYYHVPMWFGLMFLFLASVIFSIRYLRNPLEQYDDKAFAYAEMGTIFGILGLVTGMVWAKYTWGQAWSNDIKQLMTAVALLVYLAYFILRRSFDDPAKSARLAAVYNIFAFAALIPLLYVVPRLFASLHPGATGNPAFGSQDLDNTMRAVFYPSIIGWSLLGFWMAELKFRYRKLAQKVED